MSQNENEKIKAEETESTVDSTVKAAESGNVVDPSVKEEIKSFFTAGDNESGDEGTKTEETTGAEAVSADTLTAGQENGTETKTDGEIVAGTENTSASNVTASAENGTKTEDVRFTQEQMNKIAGKAREEGRASALKDLFSKFGVADENELSEIFGKGQTYDDLHEEYSSQGNSIREIRAENALLRTGVLPERWDDVKAILGTKGLEVSKENIEQALPTHPEWRGTETVATEKTTSGMKPFSVEMAEKLKNTPRVAEDTVSTIRKLGGEAGDGGNEDLESQLDRLFGMK